MPPKRDLCAQCKSYDVGAIDEGDKKWYCTSCWERYNRDVPVKGATDGAPRSAEATLPSTQPADSAARHGGSKRPPIQEQAYRQAPHDSAAPGRQRMGNRAYDARGTNALVTSAEGKAAVQRLRSMLASVQSPNRRRRAEPQSQDGAMRDEDGMAAEAWRGLLSGTPRGGAGPMTQVSLAGQQMRPQRVVAMVTHSGEPLSPHGDRVGGVGRSAYQERRKVSLNTLLSSVDDIVSQVYVCFDEDMTKLLLNGLDRVTACETADQRERQKVRVVDELLEAVGDKHYDLLQCIMYHPREVFLRLLEEFCTVDESETTDGGGSVTLVEGKGGSSGGGGSVPPRHGAMTVQFVKSGKTQQRGGAAGGAEAMGFAKSGALENKRWLAHMNQRYRALLQESELDEIFKRDFSMSGATMPRGMTITRKDDHTRVHLPPPQLVSLPQDRRVCIATTLPEWTRPAFQPITHLNTVQSNIFHTAFHTAQNMLVCAPTGAGKTVCALLVMLRCIGEHFVDGQLDRNFKIIFVAPMKALAQEMVDNFARRLAPFLIRVRELTGDMQLTKHEIAETQVIVTTPEKWDVITRKPNNDITDHVKLIILDEIHLLNEDRGPVLEAIVARTLRQGEADAERYVRLVGLSATLPNYKDVANFLQVDLQEGLKVFGPEYRPVPLEQTFIGLHNVTRNRQKMEEQLNALAYDEVLENVRAGHQVMVFVHSRKQTVGLCKYFVERARQRGQEHYFQWSGSKANPVMPSNTIKKGHSLQGRDLSALFDSGFGAHHAGLIRYDRTATEDLFRDGYIKVLCCTSTLAWGVNLPAHTVIIRGTQMYDPKRGGLVSISVLDVMQIFGRAGRPQFDTSGHGIIISDEKEVTHFLRLIAHALPIESQMQNKLCDHLNAEVNAGSISSVAEACAWLEYTYLWQRIRVNPLLYGLKINQVRRDPELKLVRQEMIHTAFTDLAVAGMVRYNPEIGSIENTDLGRLASHYYLTHETISIFNEKMQRPDSTWVESLNMGTAMNIAASASEFANLRVRQEELDELQRLHLHLPRPVQDFRISGESADEMSVQWKVTTLLKAYISRLSVEEHSLTADTNYVVQNMPRIARALFEIELERGHPLTTYTFLTLTKCLEHRCWDFEHPLLQFTTWSRRVNVTDAVWVQLAKRRPSMSLLREMTAKEIGSLVHNIRAGRDIAALVRSFPAFTLQTDVQPITRAILRVKVILTADFKWSRDISGNTELFWLLVEDQDNHFIFHHESIAITRKEVEAGEPHVVHLAVPILPQYDMYSVRLYSDRWMGCNEDYTFSIGHLHLPEDANATTKLLPLNPLRLSVIPAKYHVLYEHYNQFNAVQTQVFHAMYHTDENVFLGAPTGSGKTVAAEMAMLRVFDMYPTAKVVYIAPLKALVKERLRDWRTRLARVGRTVVELSGDATPDLGALAKAHVLCTTPEKWDGVSRSWQVRRYVTTVRLVIFDEIHMLGTDRGPILEVIVSRMRSIGWNLKAPIRLVGLSTAVSNPADLSSWLGVHERWAVFNFDPSVRPVPMTVHIAGYHGKHYCPRMMAMNKPVFNAICEKSPNKPVIVFVSSRRQTRYTALALIGFLMVGDRVSQWVHMDVDELERLTGQLEDDIVKHCFQFGVGLHHAGLLEGDRAIVERAFLAGKIQVLVATSTLAWGVNFPAHMVVVKGTEYYDGKTHGYVDFPITDLLQMIGRAGRPQFDTEGIAQVLCLESKKGFYRKFLYDPFPVESTLHKQLHVHLNAEIVSGTIKTRRDAINYLTWTFLFRRLTRNPSYYGLEDGNPTTVMTFLDQLITDTLAELQQCGCVTLITDDGAGDAGEDELLQYTVLGKLCAYYYISHHTVDLFNQRLTYRQSFADLLRLLCDAEEFNELPVRHNEDKRNIEIAKLLPLPIKESEAESPHVKAFVLFQAQFDRTPLPVDYATDQKSTLDNAVRVVQAMVDVAAYNGHLYTALRCMTLMQCMVQARWWNDNTLLQLPHVRRDMLPILRDRCHVEHAAQLANAPLTMLHTFRDTLELPQFALKPWQVQEAMAGVHGLPLLQVDVAVAGIRDDGDAHLPHVASYEVAVHLTRLSRWQKSAVAPYFSKPKDEQYWVVVGNEATGELVALKRLNRLLARATVTLQVDWDEDWATCDEVTLSLYVVCDAYLGMDQQYNFVLPRP